MKFFIPPHLTTICEDTFAGCKKLQKIEIPTNSELKEIEADAFADSTIESIVFPSSLVNLKEGWCNDTPKLTEIIINDNQLYKIYDNTFVIGKSSILNENYDVLVFCFRDIENVTIPNFIEIIGSHAFDKCKQLKEVRIPDDSKLRIIEKYAFFCSSIKRIFIPHHVKQIDEYAFSGCEQLQTSEIDENSEITEIQKELLSFSPIQNIYIPSHITQISSLAFHCCNQLQQVNFASNSELSIIDVEAFSYSSIESISIPSHVTEINDSAFFNCVYLHQVEFPMNSELRIINQKSFVNSSNESKLVL